jgi:hypothetical protein
VRTFFKHVRGIISKLSTPSVIGDAVGGESDDPKATKIKLRVFRRSSGNVTMECTSNRTLSWIERRSRCLKGTNSPSRQLTFSVHGIKKIRISAAQG